MSDNTSAALQTTNEGAIRDSSTRDVMTAREVADLLGVEHKTIYDAAARGEMPHRRLGRRLLFARSALFERLGKKPVLQVHPDVAFSGVAPPNWNSTSGPTADTIWADTRGPALECPGAWTDIARPDTRSLVPTSLWSAQHSLMCQVPSTVLLVEDDAHIRSALRESLEAEGYKVVAAANGDEALEHLGRADREPYLVLVDVLMPVMSGWRVLRALHHADRLLAVPVVVMPGRRARDVTGRRWTRKSVSRGALLCVVRSACGVLPT